MEVDLQKFRDEGYLILENVVPPEKLQDLRLTVELMVDREKARSVAERKDGDPRGGDWYQSAQPRIGLDSITAETADIIDFCLGETTLGVSAQLLQDPDTAFIHCGALCSGLIDYGYTDWHRDASSAEQAPLSGMQADLLANAPGYVQWNVALYDDDVFWILPQSHKQPSTEVQRRQLLLDPRSPLEGGVPAKLQAGNAIVYPNLMMHWGSKYTSRFRRTIHMGYRSFNAEIFPYLHQLDWYHQDEFMRHVSADARVGLMRSAELYNRERDQIERTYRAMVAGDKSAFLSDLAQLHPGELGRMVSVVLLCRIANKVVKLHQPEIAKLSVEERRPIIDGSPPAYYTENLAARFTVAEAGVLTQRFAVLNNRLREDEDRVHQHYSALYAELKPDAQNPPDFESRPLRTFNSEMPEGFGVDEFIASWKE